MTDPRRSLREILSRLTDPRDKRGLKYPLVDVVMLAVYGMMCGKSSFASMARYLKRREAELTLAFGLAAGVPSHDVFSRVFARIDYVELTDLFAEWMARTLSGVDPALLGRVAIDGKAVRAAAEKAAGGRAPYMATAFVCGLGLAVAQVRVGSKTNEITAIPELLELVCVAGATITVDAIGTQVEIMERCVRGGGHFCLQLKRNHREEFDSVELYFRDMLGRERQGRPHAAMECHRERGRAHGREEVRTYVTTCDPVEVPLVVPGWARVRCLGMCVLEREVVTKAKRSQRPRKRGAQRRKGRKGAPSRSVEVHFHVMDRPTSAAEYAELARGHWAVENTLHWVLDDALREDRSTSRRGDSTGNLAVLRKVAYNLLRMMPGGAGRCFEDRMDEFALDPALFARMFGEPIPTAQVAACAA